MLLRNFTLIIATTISSCLAHNHFDLSKILKKVENIETKLEKNVEIENCFKKNVSLGTNLGFNNHNIGIHIDYNKFLNDYMFLGTGYNLSYFTSSPINKKKSQYITLRTGVLLSDVSTVDMNLSMILSNFVEKNHNYTRFGISPGIGMTLSLNKNFSLGLNYMCEIHPKNKDGSKPRMITHNYFTKLSYHI